MPHNESKANEYNQGDRKPTIYYIDNAIFDRAHSDYVNLAVCHTDIISKEINIFNNRVLVSIESE